MDWSLFLSCLSEPLIVAGMIVGLGLALYDIRDVRED